MLYRSARAFAATTRTGLGANQAVAGRRFTAVDTRGGKSKLIFRFGMKDIPVELYPLGFVVSIALVAGGVAPSQAVALVVNDVRPWRDCQQQLNKQHDDQPATFGAALSEEER
ncbi:uncharacterized protein LOC62_02G002072 [Vanrija pseudolonga]|uniref:Uncharacterized protein n=1 Tax=Vanrija pseudolonga TaxID=143232 RepID=A0AAF1BIA6_9TREE|nr:hypothetical protein LOC62_02G002072 [Vanrija pseudolonga]